MEERPKSDGLDGGDCDSPFVAPAAVDQLYLVGAIKEWNSRWLPYRKEKTDGMDT